MPGNEVLFLHFTGLIVTFWFDSVCTFAVVHIYLQKNNKSVHVSQSSRLPSETLYLTDGKKLITVMRCQDLSAMLCHSVCVLADWWRGGWPEEGHAVVRDLRFGDPDVHSTEKQQEIKSPVRAVTSHQICHSTSSYNGSHQRWVHTCVSFRDAIVVRLCVTSLLFTPQSVVGKCIWERVSLRKLTQTSLRPSKTMTSLEAQEERRAWSTWS